MFQKKRWCAAIVAMAASAAFAQTPFPVLGTTYQIDRHRFPGNIIVCVTEQAMGSYLAAQNLDDKSIARKMVAEVDTDEDFARLKARGGCTPVSSFSQAKIVLKGKGVHRANFFAFAFGPMWGSALYFGAPIK